MTARGLKNGPCVKVSLELLILFRYMFTYSSSSFKFKVMKVETTNLTSRPLCLAVVGIRTREIMVQVRYWNLHTTNRQSSSIQMVVWLKRGLIISHLFNSICIYQSFIDCWLEYRLTLNELSKANEQMRNDKTSFHKVHNLLFSIFFIRSDVFALSLIAWFFR